MDYVFVLDVSGSMQDDGKLALSRSSIEAFVKALGEKDRAFEWLDRACREAGEPLCVVRATSRAEH